MPEKLLAASAMDLKRNEAKGSEGDVEIRLLICCSVFELFFFFLLLERVFNTVFGLVNKVYRPINRVC